MKKTSLALGLMLGLGFAVPAHALQCVPYARQISGIELSGDAWRWWSAAQGVYERGSSPQVGAVLVFKQTGHMRHGHVAVVRRVINKREIHIDHANWGNGFRDSRGAVTTDVAVVDVSPRNDWTQVRVWHEASGTYGTRVNPSFGFIYGGHHGPRPRFDDAVVQASVVSTQTISAMAAPVSAAVISTAPSSTARHASAASLNAQVLAGLQPSPHADGQAQSGAPSGSGTRHADTTRTVKTAKANAPVKRTVGKIIHVPAAKPTLVKATQTKPAPAKPALVKTVSAKR